MPSYIIPFLVFTIALSFKDIFIKQSLITGTPISLLLIIMGVTLLIPCLIFEFSKTKSMPKLNSKFNLSRYFINIILNTSMIMSIYYLDASTINVLNKSTIPLTILIGSAFGLIYTQKEKLISAFLVVITLIYAMYSFLYFNYSYIGFILFSISLIAVCIEFLLLAKATVSGNSLDVIMPPALGMISGGVLLMGYDYTADNLSLNITTKMLTLSFMAGFALLFAYSTSKARYKLLPPGIADSPTIFSFFFIYIIEVSLGVKAFYIFDLVPSLTIILFSIWLVIERVGFNKKSLKLSYK